MRRTWRTDLLYNVFRNYNEFSSEELKNMDIYQFGVFNGDSMREIVNIASNINLDFNTFNGYDVFSGMPKETNEPIFQDSWDPEKDPDAFNIVKKFGLNDSKQVSSFIENSLYTFNNQYKYKIYDGLVEETLPKCNDLKTAFYIDIDLDIYSPSKFVLDYMFKNNLITVGTLIGYDDWGGTPNFENYEHGESRAHKEICEKFNIKANKLFQIGNEFPHVHNVWVIEKIDFKQEKI
jgi:hypothetical protein